MKDESFVSKARSFIGRLAYNTNEPIPPYTPPAGIVRTADGRIGVHAIVICRAEGRRDQCGKPEYFEGPQAWTQVEQTLVQWSRDCHPEGYGDQVDFVIYYADGHTYEGTAFIRHPQCAAPMPLAVHIAQFQGEYAGTFKRPHLTQAQYDEFLRITDEEIKNGALHFLNNYVIGQA